MSSGWFPRTVVGVLAASVAVVPSLAASGSPAASGPLGEDEGGRSVTLIHVADTHGKFVPHWEKLEDGKWHDGVGGFARTYTAVQRIKQETAGRNLFLFNGDNFSSSAEMLFTRGRAGLPVMNKFKPDAYTPGNWDFTEGPQETRARYTGIPAGYPGATPKGKPLVDFPVLAASVYNAPGAPPYAKVGDRPLPPYLFKHINGVEVAVIGLTDDKPGGQARVFANGLTFHAGYNDLPPLVKEVRAKGAELVVVMSETGLSQNIAAARDIPGVDVIFSADTHEETFAPVRVRNAVDPRHTTLVVESGEGSHVGRMDLKVAGHGRSARVVSSRWNLEQVDSSVPEDPGMKSIVDQVRAPFLKATWQGPFTHGYPGGGKPLVLDKPIDTVIGTTGVDLERDSVFPTAGDEFISDAVWKLSGADIAGTAGFRYDFPVPAGEKLTVGDVYGWLPLAAWVGVGEVTGSQLKERFEGFLDSALDPNPYRRNGGYVPQLSGVRFSLDLNAPYGPETGRIVKAEVYNRSTKAWEPMEDDRVYSIAGCYSPGDALDHMCRTNGVRNMKFLQSDGSWADPLVRELPPGKMATVRPAPDGTVAAPDVLLAYAEKHGGLHTADLNGMGSSWIVVGGTLPVSRAVPNSKQPLAGAGPWWLARPQVTQ